MKSMLRPSAAALLCALLTAPSCATRDEDADIVVERESLVVRAHGDGTFDVARAGSLVFRRAEADALVLVAGEAEPRLVSTATCPSPVVSSVRDDGLELRCATPDLTLTLSIALPRGKRHATLAVDVVVEGGRDVTVLRSSPLVVIAEHGGALLLGRDPARHRILENGRFAVFDQSARLATGDTLGFPLSSLLPIPMRGRSVSNWSHLVHDLESGRALAVGALTTEASVPVFGIGGEGDGEGAFRTYAADSVFTFRGKLARSGGHVRSETVYVDPLPSDPLEAMEHYADELALAQNVVAWPKRGRPIPNGWNSWSGGSGTGGHGQAIDEPLILQSLDVFARELQPFGGSFFQVDDGWQDAKGDWQWRRAAFPSGGPALAAMIRARGLTPGLWLAPFWGEPSSVTAQKHGHWILEPEPGALSLAGKADETFDPSLPEVKAMLHERFTALRDEGWRWAKTDFTYHALLGRTHDPSITSVEAWRSGMQTIKSALGDEVFVLGIGAVGLEVGVADGVRLTLDNAPRWDEPADATPIEPGRAIRETVRTGSRRWFYGNRAFVAHPDLLFFRSMDGAPPVSLGEARTFATWVALTGGIVKIGDKLTDFETHPEWIDVVRRLLPAYPATARPLDVLTRDVPEEFRVHVDAALGAWDVVGLFHWGKNIDASASPPADLAETPRTHTVTCAGSCLVYELWSERFLGEKSGAFDVTLEPRTTQVLALRAATGLPQVLGTNRHVLMGANDLGSFVWNAGTRTLDGTVLAAAGTERAPFEHLVALHVPPGYAIDSVSVDGVEARSEVDGALARVRFRARGADHGKPLGFHAKFR